MKTDVLVVGASVAGLLAAKESAKSGAKTIVVEEDKKVGKFNKCGGLVSKSGLNSLGVDFKKSVLNSISGAIIRAGKEKLTIDAKKTKAYVINRQKFDEVIAEEAKREGAKIILNKKFPAQSIKYKVLIGADGAFSTVAEKFAFPKIDKIVVAYQAEFENAEVENAKFVNVFLDKEIFPGFFGWTIPISEERVRIGFGVDRGGIAQKSIKQFFKMEEIKKTISNAKKVYEFYAPIPIKLRERIQKNNILLVGDAAGEVKATSGGGIVIGGGCAKIAGREASEFSGAKKKLEYEKKVREKYGKILRIHSALRTLYNISPQQLINAEIKLSALFKLNKLAEKFGDMDFLLRV